MSERPIVVKVGGSLLGETRLVQRLSHWVSSQVPRRVVFVVGGGPPVRTLRALRLAEEEAHWACIGVMRQHAIALCAQFPQGCVVESWSAAKDAWERDEQPFLEVTRFLKLDDAEPDHLPHLWDVSSDSIAAHLATRHDAHLVLLKACPVTGGPYDWVELSRQGIIDVWLPRIAPRVANVTLVNLPE